MRLIDADELLSEETLAAFPAFGEKLADTTDLRDIVASCKTIHDVPDYYILKSSFSQEEVKRLSQILKKKENCSIASAEKEA